MMQNGAPQWYELSGTRLSQIAGPAEAAAGRFSLARRDDGTIVYAEDHGSGRSATLELFFSSGDSSKKPLDLGRGFAAAFARPGVVVALSPGGVLRINPENGGKDTLLGRPGIAPGTSAVAPDATAVALANDVTHAFDVFSIDPHLASATSYIGSVAVEPQALAFATPTEIVVKDANGYELFAVGEKSVSKTATLELVQK